MITHQGHYRAYGRVTGNVVTEVMEDIYLGIPVLCCDGSEDGIWDLKEVMPVDIAAEFLWCWMMPNDLDC